MVGPSCVFDSLNLSSDGLQRLRAFGRGAAPLNQINVKKLITPYPDGIMLQLVSEFVNEVVFERYYERVLRIPANAMLADLTLRHAPETQLILVGAPNAQLVSLEITGSGIRSITDEFRKLHQLQFLILDEGSLETLSLDPFANSTRITNLLFTYNRIRQLIPSRNASLVLPIVDLLLGYNRLETINGDFFRPLRNLSFVTFEGNRIQRVEGRPLVLPQLTMISFVQNQLTQLDVSQWQVPKLREIFLDTNNLTRIPVGIERLPSLITLVVENNLLTAVDLRRFDGWSNLGKIDLTGNRIRNVLVSGTGRVRLPNLQQLHLVNNQLSTIEFGRWDFPELSTLTLAYNRLRQLPDLFRLFPKLWRVVAVQNPLLCRNVRRLQQHIMNFKVNVDSNFFGVPCTTNATFTLPTGREICCVE
ncbi:leucine-rich repeat protein SHOC-2-like [Anopheles stephensi]|uniref:leucine-rich repeat protein SHOC-2-like n=1 Tax=Anopheles stephensi TaxID=30069 RepID=UPI00165884F0|nr:leucine-rich repeat protein SHOC-2-like [Anopheles stephensi]